MLYLEEHLLLCSRFAASSDLVLSVIRKCAPTLVLSHLGPLVFQLPKDHIASVVCNSATQVTVTCWLGGCPFDVNLHC